MKDATGPQDIANFETEQTEVYCAIEQGNCKIIIMCYSATNVIGTHKNGHEAITHCTAQKDTARALPFSYSKDRYTPSIPIPQPTRSIETRAENFVICTVDKQV